MGEYKAGQWIPFSPPHGQRAIGKPEPPPRKKKARDTKPKRRKRRNRK